LSIRLAWHYLHPDRAFSFRADRINCFLGSEYLFRDAALDSLPTAGEILLILDPTLLFDRGASPRVSRSSAKTVSFSKL